ncbi:MAG: endolytic transglycosylase MltG [Minisyncoccota bacterium]
MAFFKRLFPAMASALEFHLARFSRTWIAVLAVLALMSGGGYILLALPSGFVPQDVVIARGASVSAVAQELAAAHIITYPLVLRVLLRAEGKDNNIQAGTYRFNASENVLTISHRLVTGAYDIPPLRITFFEGTTVREMATRAAAAFPQVSAADFIAAGHPYEGYLFPDTYLFSPSADAASIVAAMRANFNAKIAPLSGDIQASGRSLSDIVIMASLVEKEARSDAAKRMVAGILWNRIARGMPLQVDSVFGYIHGRDTYAPSLADLRVNSPYNTYLHRGLPPGPIDNPGLASLEAAVNPAKTNYLYYLTGTDGLMHYATTYAGHEANRRKYLK